MQGQEGSPCKDKNRLFHNYDKVDDLGVQSFMISVLGDYASKIRIE